MRLLQIAVIAALATAAYADTITLKSGRVINGTYLGGSPRQVRVEVGDQIQTLDISDISRIEFGSVAPASSAMPAPAPEPAPTVAEDRPVLHRSDDNVFRPEPASAPAPAAAAAPAAPAPGSVELAAGTNIVIRMIDGVDSQTNTVGQSFAASLDQPVMINGTTVIPRGADATVKLVDAKESGKLVGHAELTLSLMSVKVNGRMVDINTQSVSRESSSRGARTAKVAGGTAALGAIIGAIAGGGEGAAIGAAAGGAAGAGAEVVTKGQQVKIPSETRLTFVLDNPVRI
jgi:hypothetical protein